MNIVQLSQTQHHTNDLLHGIVIKKKKKNETQKHQKIKYILMLMAALQIQMNILWQIIMFPLFGFSFLNF